VQSAWSGLDLRTTAWAEEVSDGRLLGVQLTVRFPAVAGEDMPLAVDQIELRQEIPMRLHYGFASRDLLLAHHRSPLATKGARERVREDADYCRCRAYRATLHPLGDVAVPFQEDHFGLWPGSTDLNGVLLGHFLWCTDQHRQRLRPDFFRRKERSITAATIGYHTPICCITHRREAEQGEGTRVFEPGPTQPTHPGRLRVSPQEERGIAMSPLVGLPRGCCHC
jgi:hypothetical protein